jgi:hypothetical protein
MQIIDVNGEKRECLSISPDSNFPGYLKIKYQSRFRKNYQHVEWYDKKEFIKNNPKLANLATSVTDPWKEELGIVSSASSITLTDKLKKWQPNEFKNYPIWISRGKGEGQTRVVNQNTIDTLILNSEWKIIPNKTSQYLISHNVHDPQVMGNTLPDGFKLPKIKKRTKIKSK